jgi:hypothetical protein
VLDPQFRLMAFHEAEKCLRQVDKLDVRQPEFWSNLLGAVVNTNIACVPDSVATSLMQESAKHEKASQHLKEQLRKKLDEKR